MAEERKLNGKGILKGIIFSILATVACMAVLALFVILAIFRISC